MPYRYTSRLHVAHTKRGTAFQHSTTCTLRHTGVATRSAIIARLGTSPTILGHRRLAVTTLMRASSSRNAACSRVCSSSIRLKSKARNSAVYIQHTAQQNAAAATPTQHSSGAQQERRPRTVQFNINSGPTHTVKTMSVNSSNSGQPKHHITAQ